MPLCPALAYPYNVIDPGLDDPKRDDGEHMLRKLRPIWRSMGRGENAYLLDSEATGSIACMVMGAGTNSKSAAVLDGLLDSNAKIKPMVRLVAPSTGLVSPETMDAEMTPEERASTIPVQGDRRCAVLGWPAEMSPQPKIIIVFLKDDFFEAGKQNAEMEITRTGANIDIHLTSFSGSRKRIKGTVQDARMLDRAFDTADLIRRTDRELLPSPPNDVPASIQLEVADFWQTALRAHVLTAACQPCDNMSNRFVAFSRVTIGSVGRDAASKRIVLKGTLHPSSGECVCGLHGLKPIQCKFVSSKVEFKMSMCGHKLTRPSRAMEFGICPLHQGATPRVSTIPDLCCHSTTCEVSCAHFTDKREFKPGLWIRNIPLDKCDVLHVQSLITAALRCSEEVAPIIGKRKHEEIKEICDSHAQSLSTNLEQVNRFKSCRTKVQGADDLMRMDWKATDMLRERKVRQWRRPSTKELVLAGPKPDGSGGLAPLTKPDSELNDHHLWMFMAPFRY